MKKRMPVDMRAAYSLSHIILGKLRQSKFCVPDMCAFGVGLRR